jgi:predicted 2-oxoglutarate/Fe(II)-dependent dioxygenase YbiX
MAYINDGFTGGELHFPEIGITYKPSAGDIIIYQAKEKHEVLELTDGIRYTFGYGLRGPVND